MTSSDYFSIDNITLGYTLPKAWTSRIGISGLRFYGSIENVAYLLLVRVWTHV